MKTLHDFIEGKCTHHALAEKVGVSDSAVSSWLSNKSIPERHHIEDLGKTLAPLAAAPEQVELPPMWGIRCILRANELNNYNKYEAGKFHDSVHGFYYFDGKGGVTIGLQRKL